MTQIPLFPAHGATPAAPDATDAFPPPDRRTPAEPPDLRDLRHPLTFFVTGRERARILRALRRLDGDRAFALMRALNLA
ncbi:MAG: hypothetical protein IT431_04630 [Phycisphaerales bacterium]|nr:hypothetical protein [Phycisphaerales bacterium]